MKLAISVFLVAAAMLAGCATATIEDAVPQGALVSAAESSDDDRAVSSGAPSDTGEYPNLNEVQRGAVEQMTPEERKAYLAELRAARARQANTGGNGSRGTSEAELKKLARTHNDEVLKQIENETSD